MNNAMLDPAVDPATVSEADKPTPKYMMIFLILGVVTVAELGVAFIGLSKLMTIIVLIVMALYKAILVALYYMHLRYEPRRLKLIVLAPIPLALILVIAVLTEY